MAPFQTIFWVLHPPKVAGRRPPIGPAHRYALCAVLLFSVSSEAFLLQVKPRHAAWRRASPCAMLFGKEWEAKRDRAQAKLADAEAAAKRAAAEHARLGTDGAAAVAAPFAACRPLR